MAKKLKDELLKGIRSRLKKLARAEGTVREQLGFAAVEILCHYTEHKNGTLVPALLKVLTPVNRKAAQAFMDTFVKVDEDGKQVGNKKGRETIDAARADFLSSGATFWEWVDREVEVKVKEIDLKKNLIKALKEAVGGIDTEKRQQVPMEQVDLLATVFDAISVEVFAAYIARK